MDTEGRTTARMLKDLATDYAFARANVTANVLRSDYTPEKLKQAEHEAELARVQLWDAIDRALEG